MVRVALALSILVLLPVAEAAETVRELAEDGPHAVKILEFPDLVDEARENRSVPIKVLLPAGGGSWPLIVVSHGGMGTWDGHIYQAKHLASRGYVVLCVEHVRSNNAATKKHMRAATGGLKQRIATALQRITRDPKSVLERPRDISFAIDQAVEWNRSHEALRRHIDTRRIAVMGHSYGAYTTLAVCGARPILDHLDFEGEPQKGLAPSLADKRVTVGIAMSPQGPGTSRFSAESYKTINRPMLCFSGSKDDQLGHDGATQPASRRLDGFKLFPAGDKDMVWLANCDHGAFSDNPRAWLLPSKARKDAQRIARAMTAAYCGLHLKRDRGMAKYLTEAQATSLSGTVVTSVKWYKR